MQPEFSDALRDWLGEPIDTRCADPRFTISRATPEQYEEIYALLVRDARAPRSRAGFDWLYRQNPLGEARCWLTREDRSGELIASETRWPWPLARGASAVRGEMIGDAIVAQRFQRQGIGDLRAPFRQAHPWYRKTAAFSWPNKRSRKAAIKHGYGARLRSPIPRWVRPAWFPIAEVPGNQVAIRIVERFDDSFDALTMGEMQAPGYWSPHDHEFLNWRYGAHPDHEYVSVAAFSGGEPGGYGVVRVGGPAATLMEYVAAPGNFGQAVLHGALSVALEAGCNRVNFFAIPHARWRALRRYGFLRWRSRAWLQVRGQDGEDDAVWQLVPGDNDVL